MSVAKHIHCFEVKYKCLNLSQWKTVLQELRDHFCVKKLHVTQKQGSVLPPTSNLIASFNLNECEEQLTRR